jgi:hypothetical protein
MVFVRFRIERLFWQFAGQIQRRQSHVFPEPAIQETNFCMEQAAPFQFQSQLILVGVD